MAIDPYRVLGLPPGATMAEVKRAYRRLAKANHPDSAGESALPRFLEIQRAYESLTTAGWRPGMRRPASGAAPGGAEPWRADPTRARSTPGAQPPGATGAGPGGGGRAAGSRPPGAGSGKASTGARPKPGAGSRADGAGAGSGGGTAAGSTGRRRPAKKATFGSTTYDEAKEQADTSWAGASWYGPSSGEYWRVNPREYADPRKHGPEYLARAAARAAAAAERRARQGSGGMPGEEGAPDAPEPASAGEPTAASRSRQAAAGGRERAWPDERPSTAPPPRPAWTQPSGEDAADVAGPPDGAEPPAQWLRFNPELSPGMRRLLRAVVAWPPLGIAAAAVIGEATGCAAFEATCTAPADLYPWLAQVAILLVLLALPAVARILAGGTVAVVLLAFPVAAALSASGATYDRTYGPAALIAVLAVVWVVGVAAVLLRRAVTRALP